MSFSGFTYFSTLAHSQPDELAKKIRNIARKKVLLEVTAIVYDSDKKEHVAYLKSNVDLKKIKTGPL